MTGQVYINNKDLFAVFGAELIENSYSNLLLKPNLKEDASNNMRSQSGEQLFIDNQQYDVKETEITFLITGSSLTDYLQKLEALTTELDNGIFALKIIPLQTIYHLRRKSYLSLDPYMSGSVGKLVVSIKEPNPKNRITL